MLQAPNSFQKEKAFSICDDKDMQKAMIDLLGLRSHLLGMISLNLIDHLKSSPHFFKRKNWFP